MLDEVIALLAKDLPAESIYLFGSQASGKPGPESDYDLPVVLPGMDLPRHPYEVIAYDLLWGLTIPVDVLVMTLDEFHRQAQVKSSLAAAARATGILLYGKSQDR